MSGADGVVMLDHPRALEDGRFEKIAVEFILANFADVGGDLAPHVGDESDVPQCRVTAELAEHVKIPSGGPAEPIVRDTMDVDDPGKLRPFLIPIGGSVQKSDKRQTPRHAYMSARKNAITFKISVSLFVVLSNPGVSMRVTARPSRMN